MRTVYSNTRHPKFVKWSIAAALVISVACLVLYICVDDSKWYKFLLYIGWFAFFYVPTIGGAYFLNRYIIDDEADTLTCSSRKKYPMKISDISSISYKESRKGKFRALLVHANGVGFMDIRTTRENADRITAQLTHSNPSIVIKHVNC